MKNKTEVYRLPQGKIFIGKSNRQLSIGVLTLKPHKALEKHNRPVAEQLTQASGTSTMILFKNSKPRKIILKEGDKLVIPASQYHIHSNTSNKNSSTIWRFDGDISKVIAGIRERYKRA